MWIKEETFCPYTYTTTHLVYPLRESSYGPCLDHGSLTNDLPIYTSRPSPTKNKVNVPSSIP